MKRDNLSFGKMSDADLAEELINQSPILKNAKKCDTKYQYTNVPMKVVAENIGEYVIPELQAACKKLWAKNVFTFMVSNREDQGYAYIMLSKLSEENKTIFERLMKEFPKIYHVDSYRKALTIRMKDSGNIEEMEEKFLKAVVPLKLQDVQSDGYITAEDFLVEECGFFTEVANPNYKEDNPMPVKGETEESKAFLKRFDAWSVSVSEPEKLKIFDESKVVKPIIEYVKEHKLEELFDEESGRIYHDDFYLKGHKAYISQQSRAEKSL